MVGGTRGWSHGHLSSWRDGVPGPTATAAQLPVAMGTTVARVTCTTSPATTTFSGAVGSAAMAGRLELQAAVPRILPHLSVPIHPTLDVQVCEILQHLAVLGNSTFAELWMFYKL